MILRIFINGIDVFDMDVSILIDVPYIPRTGDHFGLSPFHVKELENKMEAGGERNQGAYNCFRDIITHELIQDICLFRDKYYIDLESFFIVGRVSTDWEENMQTYIPSIELMHIDEDQRM